ncbi:MAG: hypothetical protein IKF91_03110 [Bacilli bacterium]|nr:hypothetical protein [Bacilli bacterium]
MKTFHALNVSSKFAICGLPIRVDTYKTCSFGCSYCFANNRKIMEFEKILQVGNIDSVKRKLDKIFNKHEIKENDLLSNLIINQYTWHCGGMSDPFQPCEEKYHITEELIKVTKPYKISIILTDDSSISFNQSKDEYKDFLEKDMDMLPDADKCRFYKFDIFKTEKGV